MLERICERREAVYSYSHTASANANWAAPRGISMDLPQKTKTRITIKSIYAIPTVISKGI